MKNLWPTSFEEQDVRSPKEILEQQAKFLPKLTDDTVYAVVEPVQYEPMIHGVLSGDFYFDFLLKSQFLPDYQFRVMTFSHDITIYPIHIELEYELRKELKLTDGVVQLDNDEEFINFIAKVFNSERIKKVIGAMIKLAKS